MKVNLLPRLQDAKETVEAGLVFGHATRLRSVYDASLAADRLQPTVVKVRLVSIHESEHVPKAVFHRDARVVIKLSGSVQEVALFVPDLIANGCDALLSRQLPAYSLLRDFLLKFFIQIRLVLSPYVVRPNLMVQQ